MTEHPRVTENRVAKAMRLAAFVRLLHSHLGREDSVAAFARSLEAESWDAIGVCLGEHKSPDTSINVCIQLLDGDSPCDALAGLPAA